MATRFVQPPARRSCTRARAHIRPAPSRTPPTAQVHATVRDPANAAKVAHLTGLDGAAERLKLFGADLLRAGSFDEALAGCAACVHTASPFFNQSDDPENELLRPAEDGTLNVMRSCARNGVKVVALTSSMAAVFVVPPGSSLPPKLADTWSDVEFMRSVGLHCAYPRGYRHEVWGVSAASQPAPVPV